MSGCENIHGTAIRVDTIGLIFVGPSGSGKSGLAFDCLVEAAMLGKSAALISDDRVILSREHDRVIARGPQSIRGLMELRYSGFVSVNWVSETDLHFAVRPVGCDEDARLPPDNERFALTSSIDLPVIRVPEWSRFPLSLVLARISSLRANQS